MPSLPQWYIKTVVTPSIVTLSNLIVCCCVYVLLFAVVFVICHSAFVISFSNNSLLITRYMLSFLFFRSTDSDRNRILKIWDLSSLSSYSSSFTPDILFTPRDQFYNDQLFYQNFHYKLTDNHQMMLMKHGSLPFGEDSLFRSVVTIWGTTISNGSKWQNF